MTVPPVSSGLCQHDWSSTSARSAASRPIIDVRSLTKEFRRPRRAEGRFGAIRTLFTRNYEHKLAVDHVSFSVERGEVIGYLGPNGAGKSTTVKMLTGILYPTSGTVEVATPQGRVVPWRDRRAHAKQIGVVFGQRTSLWWDLTLAQSLELVASIYEVPAEQYKRNLGQVRELLGLDDFMGAQVRQLSLGQRVRGDLAAALLYEPPTLYLDEPTIGLDVLARETVRSFIEEVNREHRTTVLLTTHDLADVERLCRRILLIDQGRLLYDGEAKGLVDQYAPYRDVLVVLDEAPGTGNGSPAGPDALPGARTADKWHLGRFEADRQPDGKWCFRIQKRDSIHELMTAITQAQPLRDLAVVEPRLEDVVRRLYAETAGRG